MPSDDITRAKDLEGEGFVDNGHATTGRCVAPVDVAALQHANAERSKKSWGYLVLDRSWHLGALQVRPIIRIDDGARLVDIERNRIRVRGGLHARESADSFQGTAPQSFASLPRIATKAEIEAGHRNVSRLQAERHGQGALQTPKRRQTRSHQHKAQRHLHTPKPVANRPATPARAVNQLEGRIGIGGRSL